MLQVEMKFLNTYNCKHLPVSVKLIIVIKTEVGYRKFPDSMAGFSVRQDESPDTTIQTFPSRGLGTSGFKVLTPQFKRSQAGAWERAGLKS